MRPSQIRRVDGWRYGYGWPPNQISRSRDGEDWEEVPNEEGFQGYADAFGVLSGGDPPGVPQPPRK